jgi:DNA-binding NarL/FixJ family response regulator
VNKVLIVDSHAVVRDGIKKLVDGPDGAVVFGEATSPAECIRLARERAWDIAVLDLALAGRDGLEVLKELRQIRPRMPVLILSRHSEEQYARRAFKAGAAGYVSKDSAREELLKAFDKVLKGGRYVSPSLAEAIVVGLGPGSEHPRHEALSDREFQVMGLIASGKTVSQIGELLSISPKTISTYRARILNKMGLKTSAELTHYVIKNHLDN